MIKLPALLTASALSFTFAVSAQAATITFDAVPSSGNPILTHLSTDGFDFDGLHFHTVDTFAGGLVSNGTIYLASESESDLGRPITMTRAGGGTFTLNRFDGAETFYLSPTWFSILVTGVQSGGGVLSTLLTLDGIADGGGGVADFQTFALNWTDLVSVTFDGRLATGARGGFTVDNIVVDSATAVPEPASLTLLGTGIALAARRLRKRTS
jgi:hypothetical protein